MRSRSVVLRMLVGARRRWQSWVPQGTSLPQDAWQRRHLGILALLGLHAVGLAAFGVVVGAGWAHALLEGGLVGAIGALATWPRLGRRARSVVAAFGLMTSSAVLTHLSGGYIEAHFHFFVTLGIIFLYEDWLPYVLAVAYVAMHHGVAGTLDPASVFNHPDAIARPWLWAGIHAFFIMGLSAALVVVWAVIESARSARSTAQQRAQDLKRQLHAQEKMAALGSLVAGLAHEVRTPLTVVSTSASALELAAARSSDKALAARVVAQTADIRASVERMDLLVRQLRRFHALGPDLAVEQPLHEVVGEAVRLFSSANGAARALVVELEPTPPVRLSPLGVHQVVINLLTNAVDATRAQDGRIRVATRAERDAAVLVVEDNGVGVPRELRERIFDPLFTTKAEGMGLGLHIVRRIVDAHGAHVDVASEPGTGTTFALRFPLASPPGRAIPLDAPALSAPPAPGSTG